MPDDYLPTATGVLIAGEDMLRVAGHVLAAAPPADWSRAASGFRNLASSAAAPVQPCGDFWIIERTLSLPDGYLQEQAEIASAREAVALQDAIFDAVFA